MTTQTALAHQENRAIATKATEIDVFRLGEVLAKSGYFQDARDASQAVVKILYGQEIGLSPMASMSSIYIVKGKPTLSATAIAGAIKRKDSPYDYRVVEHTDKICTLDFYENGEKTGQSSFSAQDAVQAKLSSDTWQKFPKNMLFARAISNGAKWFCPDIFGGAVIYTPDELDQKVDAEGEIVLDQKQIGKISPNEAREIIKTENPADEPLINQQLANICGDLIE